MSAFGSLSAAIVKGYLRDKQQVFFTVLFPLMFLVLFGGVFANQGTSKIDMTQVGDVTLIDDLPKDARAAFDDAFDVTTADDWDEAVTEVREGDTTLAIREHGDDIQVRYSDADQVGAAVAQGTLQSFVSAANLAATGEPPTYKVDSQRVEDESLDTIQFVTPGLLGWAIATSATFGAATTLTGWRNTKLLRRLRLAPVSTSTIVSARVGVTIAIALGQMAIFLGLGTLAFGLRLTGWWWLSIPLIVAGTLAFMSMGLFAGAVAKTVEGAVGLANFLVLPMAFLAGSFFPLDGAPGWLQVVSHLLPLRYLNDAMLDVMVRGEGISAILMPMGVLLGFMAVMLLLASRFFSWETD
jgi:ABC-2 type transport system permease protein